MEELQNNSQNAQQVQNDTPKVEEPFKVFKTKEDFDNYSAYLRKSGEEKALKNAKVNDGETVLDYKEYEKKYRKDLEAQIRADIERQAKMTEAEKLAEERAKMLEQFKTERIEINREKARNLLSKAGFEDDDMEVYLDFVNEDTEVSLGRIQRVCDTQKARMEKQKKAIIDELQANSPNMKLGGLENVNALQSQYDEAKNGQNLMLMSSIIRQANEQGITLRQ